MDVSSLAALVALLFLFALIWAFGAVCIKAADLFPLQRADAEGGRGPQGQASATLD